MTDVIETRYSKLVAGFTKLFSTIIHSTVWREEMHVKVVWVTMLAMADRNGRVFSSLPGLADASRVSLPQCIEALERLSSPDPYSRTKEHEGRRIVEIDGGWELLNYLKYRETRDQDERRLQSREAVRRHRAKATVSHRKPRKPMKAQAEAEAEAEAETENVPASPATPQPTQFTPEEKQKYVAACWQLLCERRNAYLPEMSSADFDQACRWIDQGIPLRIALRGLADCSKPPPTLRYADPAVKEAHKNWTRTLQV